MSLPVINGRPRRAVLYGRVSKALRIDAGGTTESVNQQLDVMLEQAERENVTVVGPFRDDGVSASRYSKGKARSGWGHTMQAILAGEADELWTWEISRATRDRPVWVALINACIAHNVLISVGGRLHDPLDPDDGFMLDLQAALAVRESAMTSKRIKRDVEARAKQGRPHGKIPYGYRREYDPHQGRRLLRQVPEETTAPVIQEMARRVLAGETPYAIAHDFNTRGIPSPETVRQRRLRGPDVPSIPWTLGEVKDQLLSPTNAGMRVHQKAVLSDATWPPIISAADHVALGAILATRKPFRDGGVKHLLTGIAECGVCGAKLRRVKNRTYPSYACFGVERRGAACVASVQPPLDALVIESVIGFCERPDVAARLVVDSGDDAAAEAAREAAELRARLDSFIISAASPGGISPDALAEVEARLRPLIADAERRAVPDTVPPLVTGMLGAHARETWEGMEMPARRQVIRFLMRVVLNPNPAGRKRGAKGFDPSRVDVIWLLG